MSSLFRIFSSRIWSNSYFFSRLSMIVEISDVFTTLSFWIFSWVLFINLVMALCWALLLCFGLSIVMALQFKGNSGLVGLVLRCHRKGDCSVQLVLEKLNTTSQNYINNRYISDIWHCLWLTFSWVCCWCLCASWITSVVNWCFVGNK